MNAKWVRGMPFNGLRAGIWILILTIGLQAAASVAHRRSNPVVEGKSMSDWALALVCERYRRDEYHVKPEYMRVFRAHREQATEWLMHAVDYQHPKPRLLWNQFAGKFPGAVGKSLHLKIPNPANRWAGVLALSNLAREKPDPRIAPFFMKCMKHSSTQVRKIAAYEAGAWLDPQNPQTAVQILRFALSDVSSEVRRDACRRIIASTAEPWSAYSASVRGLLPDLDRMDTDRTPHVARALAALKN
jgi:hypothetical protein